MSKILLCLLLSSSICISREVLASDDESGPSKVIVNHIPTPKAIQKDVSFWTKIFRDYDISQCVFHDKRRLDAVYYVLDLPVNDPERSRYLLADTQSKIERSLERFRSLKKPRNWFEKKVWGGIPRNLRNLKFLANASKRVRCQSGISNQFNVSLRRSKKYLPAIERLLQQHGLPQDLKYIPHLESGFNNKSTSSAGARGLWQLMPETAKKYLTINRFRDERVFPSESTFAAIMVLKRAYRETKSWPLAITAYNYGLNGVRRAMRMHRTRSFTKIHRRHQSRIFKFAARNFFPSFLAVRNLSKEAARRDTHPENVTYNAAFARKKKYHKKKTLKKGSN